MVMPISVSSYQRLKNEDTVLTMRKRKRMKRIGKKLMKSG